MRHWKWNAATSATACALAGLALPTVASAKEGAELDVSAGLSAAANPFLSSGGGTASTSVQIQLDPSVYTENETSRVAIDARLRYNYWFQHYYSDLAGDISLRANKTMSERTSGFAYGTIRSSKQSIQDYFLSNDLPILEPDFPDPNIPVDVTSSGQQSRVTTFVGGGGISHALSPNDSVSFDASYSHNLYQDDSGTDFRTVSIGSGYTRKLNERTSATLDGRFGFTNFLGVERGDGTYTTGTVGIIRQLGPSSSASLKGGIAVSNVKDELGEKDSKLYFIVSGDYCRQMLNGRACFRASRDVRPSSFGSVSDVNTVDLSWTKQLEQEDYISLNVGYSQTDAIIGPYAAPGNRISEFGGLSARYTRRLNNQLDLFANGNVTKAFDEVVNRDVNIQITVGIKLRLG